MPALETIDTAVLSDMYKDAYGTRPRTHDFWNRIASMTEAEYAAFETNLRHEVDLAIAADLAEEARAAKAFEAHISDLMTTHGIDRATAIRWDMQAMDTNDEQYYCWLHGLSYSYDLRRG